MEEISSTATQETKAKSNPLAQPRAFSNQFSLTDLSSQGVPSAQQTDSSQAKDKEVENGQATAKPV